MAVQQFHFSADTSFSFTETLSLVMSSWNPNQVLLILFRAYKIKKVITSRTGDAYNSTTACSLSITVLDIVICGLILWP